MADGYELPDKRADPEGFKRRIQRFYGFWNRNMDGLAFGDVSTFMNWGYLSAGPGEAAFATLPHVINISSVQLILELVGPTRLIGLDILDIGCGRGGTVETLAQYFEPRSITGIDLTPENIAFCRKAVTSPRTRFLEGDAESLSFADASFDAVTNVESSHCYPAIAKFYSEVSRVLKPGGIFLYTDVFDMAEFPNLTAAMAENGLDILSDRDITTNVLLAREKEGQEQIAAIDGGDRAEADFSDAQVLDLVVARPGSEMHAALIEGRHSYRILRARKRATVATGNNVRARALRQRALSDPAR